MSPTRWRLVSFLALQFTKDISQQLDDSTASRFLRHCWLGACALGHQCIARQVLLWPDLILCVGIALRSGLLASHLLFVHRRRCPGFLALCLAGGCEAYVIPQIVCIGQPSSHVHHWPDRAGPSFSCRCGCRCQFRIDLAIDLFRRDGIQRVCRGRFLADRSPVSAMSSRWPPAAFG